MQAIISIKKSDNTILTTTQEINFDVLELPYGCSGFGFNGSSMSSEENLNIFWSSMSEILAQNNLTNNDYMSLMNIKIGEDHYGLINCVNVLMED